MKGWVVLVVLGIVALVVGGYVGYREFHLSDLRISLTNEILDMSRTHDIQVAAAESTHRAVLADPDVTSGRLAARRHDEEWQRRLAHDTSFAFTPREKTILEIAGVSQDQTMTAEQVLRDVAVLASPKGSEVTVSKQASGYVVDVAFDMAVVSEGEHGAYTKHSTTESLKKEVIEIISRVMKDLYDYCGQRGIAKIRVACKHGVILWEALADGTRKKRGETMSLIYKCSISQDAATTVSGWRTVPLYRVTSMLRVEHDEFPSLWIETSGSWIVR